MYCSFFFFNDTATTEIYTLSLHDALPICRQARVERDLGQPVARLPADRGELPADVRAVAGERERGDVGRRRRARSEEHTSELQSRQYLVCRLLLEKKIQRRN